MVTTGVGAYWTDSLREIATKVDLHDYWFKIAYDVDFLEAVPLYTSIRDLLRRYAEGRKHGARMSVGQFADLAPVKAAQMRQAAALKTRTMPQRMVRLEEEVHGLRQLLDEIMVTYPRYEDSSMPYHRQTKRRTDGASTSAAQHIDDQPDP
nr:hypothetical protein [Tanacetum cinerariifolium]